MEDKTIILNRLLKNHRKLKKWLTQNGIEAYRLYDKDIPQYPYIIDLYKDSAIVYEKGKLLENTLENQNKIGQHQSNILEILHENFGLTKERIFFKKREIKKGKDQYQTQSKGSQTNVIVENACRYLINLSDYLDSGLFLDHRYLRKVIKEDSAGKSFLNLFCYTGSFSVAAAMGQAQTTSVDLSKTYLHWARRNFELNDLDIDKHQFIHSDVFEFLKNDQKSYDTIFCDPPSFSNSKRMNGSFDVQRDHLGLLRLCLSKLTSQGELYFSTNLRGFKLDPEILEVAKVKDISLKSIPRDFTDLKIHYCFHLRRK